MEGEKIYSTDSMNYLINEVYLRRRAEDTVEWLILKVFFAIYIQFIVRFQAVLVFE